MLKAGEYSPNNPLIRGERPTGDVLLGLGEYERRRNTLRKIRQRQYKEYLDQQAKKKQEAKEQAERERKESEEKERLREERERERLDLERVNSSERRRASVSHSYVSGSNNTYTTKVDTGVQVDRRSTPLSVAVQTEDDTLYRVTPSPGHNLLTQAERELSPHTVGDGKEPPCQSHQWDWKAWDRTHERRRSYGDYDERTMSIQKKPRDRLTSELRHTYMPSIFDAEAIRLRNEQAEKEAAERRQFYQKELKDQIMEQQRIKEERKNREKMLEQAEMRRLEEQLRSLKMAQEREIHRQHDINTNIKDSAVDYDRKRTSLQKEIDLEHQALLKAANHPKRNTHTSKSESPTHTQMPFHYKIDEKRPTYTANIPENSVFSQNYDVESYLRRNLNPTKESFYSNNNIEERRLNKIENRETEKRNVIIDKAVVHENPKFIRQQSENINTKQEKYGELRKVPDSIAGRDENYEEIRKHLDTIDRANDNFTESKNLSDNFERPLDNWKEIKKIPDSVDKYQEYKEIRRQSENVEKVRNENIEDHLPIPVLRHSIKPQVSFEEKSSDLSEKMRIVDDKWRVPAVQKNILKTLPDEKGKNVSILTQLGSIRRQLQLEQLKLDKMLSKTND